MNPFRNKKKSDLSDHETDAAQQPIVRLCRQYVTLAVGAAIVFLLHISLNTWVFSVYITAALSLLILSLAIYYGTSISRQARLDARRNEKALEDARQRTLEIATLYDTTQKISESRELTPFLETILDRATRLLSASGGAIFLHDAEHDDFHIAVGKGVGMPIGKRLPPNEGLSEWVTKIRAPMIINDYQNWEGHSDKLSRLPIRAIVCVPMIRRGELIGVLSAHEAIGTRRIFTDADARLLSLFAGSAAGAVRNAQLIEELRRSEERFRIASECASDLVYERDLIANTVRFFGQKGGPKLSETIEEFRNAIHPEDMERVWAALQNHLENGAPFSEEYRISNNNGNYITIADRAVAILNQDGKPIRLVGSANDITERKRAEQLKSDFISFVTHQLRTPLSGVKWMLELAMDEKDNPEEMQSFIADARLSTERLIRMVNDLLDISRLERGKQNVAQHPVDLEKLTRDAAGEMSPSLIEMKQTLKVEIASNLPRPDADRQLLRQAIMNLLSNSIKYTPAEGDINICISTEQNSIRWEISDTGIGIPKEDQGKLFEIFYRAGNVLAIETEGTGLGLYLARLIVEQFGGRIWCESEEGAGSKFIFMLPIVRELPAILEEQAETLIPAFLD